MSKIYVLAAVCAAFFCAYRFGVNAGKLKCELVGAQANVAQQEQIIKKIEVINAEVFNTGVADIRRVLREKYTIAE